MNPESVRKLAQLHRAKARLEEEIADVLEEAVGDVVHRDTKPANDAPPALPKVRRLRRPATLCTRSPVAPEAIERATKELKQRGFPTRDERLEG